MNDLDQLLRESGSDLTLPTPLSEVAARGTALRRRRRTIRTGLAAAAVFAIAGGVLVANDAGPAESPQTTPVAAGWSESLLGLPADETARYTELCRVLGDQLADNAPNSDLEVFQSDPVATTDVDGPDGGLVVLVFHSGGAFAECTVDADAVGGPRVKGAMAMPTLHEVGEHVTPTGTFGNGEFALAAGTTSPEVAAVHLTIAGTPIAAAVENGVFAAVVPADASAETLREATVEAFDADGGSLEVVDLLW